MDAAGQLDLDIEEHDHGGEQPGVRTATERAASRSTRWIHAAPPAWGTERRVRGSPNTVAVQASPSASRTARPPATSTAGTSVNVTCSTLTRGWCRRVRADEPEHHARAHGAVAAGDRHRHSRCPAARLPPIAGARSGPTVTRSSGQRTPTTKRTHRPGRLRRRAATTRARRCAAPGACNLTTASSTSDAAPG